MHEGIFQIVSEVLAEHAPNEFEAFELVGRELIASRLLAEKPKKQNPKTFGFASEIEAGLLMVHLVAGTLAAVETFLSAQRLKDEAALRKELKKVWFERLVANNVPPLIAQLASEQKTADLLRFLDMDEIRK